MWFCRGARASCSVDKSPWAPRGGPCGTISRGLSGPATLSAPRVGLPLRRRVTGEAQQSRSAPLGFPAAPAIPSPAPGPQHTPWGREVTLGCCGTASPLHCLAPRL